MSQYVLAQCVRHCLDLSVTYVRCMHTASGSSVSDDDDDDVWMAQTVSPSDR